MLILISAVACGSKAAQGTSAGNPTTVGPNVKGPASYCEWMDTQAPDFLGEFSCLDLAGEYSAGSFGLDDDLVNHLGSCGLDDEEVRSERDAAVQSFEYVARYEPGVGLKLPLQEVSPWLPDVSVEVGGELGNDVVVAFTDAKVISYHSIALASALSPTCRNMLCEPSSRVLQQSVIAMANVLFSADVDVGLGGDVKWKVASVGEIGLDLTALGVDIDKAQALVSTQPVTIAVKERPGASYFKGTDLCD